MAHVEPFVDGDRNGARRLVGSLHDARHRGTDGVIEIDMIEMHVRTVLHADGDRPVIHDKFRRALPDEIEVGKPRQRNGIRKTVYACGKNYFFAAFDAFERGKQGVERRSIVIVFGQNFVFRRQIRMLDGRGNGITFLVHLALVCANERGIGKPRRLAALQIFGIIRRTEFTAKRFQIDLLPRIRGRFGRIAAVVLSVAAAVTAAADYRKQTNRRNRTRK